MDSLNIGRFDSVHINSKTVLAMSQRKIDKLERELERLAYAVLWDLVLVVLVTYVVLMIAQKTDILFPWKALILMGFIYWFSVSVLGVYMHYKEKRFQSPISLFFKSLLSLASIGGSLYALPSVLPLEAWLTLDITLDTPILVAFSVGITSAIIGLIFLTIRAQRWEGPDSKLSIENIENISSLIQFKISFLLHNLKTLAPSVDIQIVIQNDSIFDVKLKKFIFRPLLSGVKGGLSECTYDHEIEIPHQNSNWFDTTFMISTGIAEYLENCKRAANAGKHGKVIWHFICTAYFTDSKEFKISQQISHHKEWYEINLPPKREV